MPTDKTIAATDLEDFDEVDVVEVLVAVGDSIEQNQSIVTLESDKAMMEFPSPEGGVVKEISVAVGGKVKQGDPLIVVTASDEGVVEKVAASVSQEPTVQPEQAVTAQPEANLTQEQVAPSPVIDGDVKGDSAYASPAVRKYASELGVDIQQVPGSAERGRVKKRDVQHYVQQSLSSSNTSRSPTSSKPLPDFSQFGPIEEHSLNKLRQISAQHLVHAWHVAPHVTQFDEADINELEAARKQLKEQVEASGAKLTLLPFIMKALVKCLQKYPDFNSSINESVTALIHKKYFHIGVAVDTPRGLVVPVFKDVDQKKIPVLASELMEVSIRAREGKLTPKDMQGGCMSISSIGGIGGQHFTPIINYPEVAILGVSRTQKRLVKKKDKVSERLILPLSLSYDHRAIDGVAAVRFTTMLKEQLSDVWSLML